MTNLRVFCSVALIASASLGFELLQTRVLSALYFNNLVYVTVTIALLGFGTSGVLASVMQRRLANPERIAAFCAAGLAVSIILCIYLASALPGAFPFVSAAFKMIVSYFILVVPFIFAGGALSLLFMSHGKHIFGLYFADLTASALAAVLFSLLLQPLGAPGFAWACSGTALAAFLILTPSVGIRLRYSLPAVMALVAGYFLLGNSIVRNRPEIYKSTGRFFLPEWSSNKLEASVWTTIAKIDVFSDSSRNLITGEYIGRPPNFMYLAQDNDAHTNIHGEKDLAYFADRGRQGRPSDVNTLVYFIEPKADNVLVIGVGGGVDVIEARSFGAQHIDGAEINAATVDLVTKHFANFTKWPTWENIKIEKSEGRRFVRISQKKYDVIVMRGVDTFAALSSGAYVLSENYLYTVEAMKDYMNALKPNGTMVIHRWFFRQPRESLRLTNLFLSAAETTGVGPADQRLMVINEEGWASTFIKRTPFTPKEVQIVTEKMASENYAWVYIPKVLGAAQKSFETQQFKRQNEDLSRARNAYASLVSARGRIARAAFERSYPFKIDPVHDDSPFFFEYYKGRVSDAQNEYSGSDSFGVENLRGPVVHYVLYMLLFVTTAFSALGMGMPLAIFEREGARIAGAWGLVGFFSSLGVGFMFVEVGCMQWLSLYLGHPMYSLMVVLAALLFYAGLGSLVAGRLDLVLLSKLRVGMFGTAVFIPAWLIAMKYLIPLTERWALSGRITVVLASLLPLGLAMGVPFATGLRYLADHQPRFIPWAWGINGLTSVAASILAVILAMRIGFTAVVLLGSLVYIAGYIALALSLQAATARLNPGTSIQAAMLQETEGPAL